MKRMLLLSLIGLLAACGNEDVVSIDEPTKEVNEVEEVEEVVAEPIEQVSEHPFPANANPIGNATIQLSTPGGDTANGNVPTLFVSSDDSVIQIGVDYNEFDGSLETFVYINEIFNTAEQVGERSQSSLNLSGENLEPGEYTVTAAQFEGNDPTNEPINLTQAKYKVEQGS